VCPSIEPVPHFLPASPPPHSGSLLLGLARPKVYVCGEPEAVPVPESPSGVRVSDAKCARIHRQAGIVSSRLAGAELAKAQSCFLPISPTGLPVIGPVEGVDGAIVATGLGCWGILNAPMTGKIVSEMIVDGRVTSDIDVEPFLPRAPR